MTGCVKKTLEWMATYHLGQFVIKKMDLLLWSLEVPAKYSVDGRSKNDTRNLPWPMFWIILINLQIVRSVASMVVVRFNKNAIESKDIVKILQKWRRSLRCIRFRGLQSMRESQNGKANSSQDVGTSPYSKSSKKRNHDEMMDHELLDELMNRTYSDTDNTDSTFMISKFGDISSNSSQYGQSLSEEYQSPSKDKDSTDSSLQDTLPISSSESELRESNTSTKSNESTFVSTVDDTEESALTEEESSNSTNGQSEHGENNESTPTDSTEQPKPGKEQLNVPVDPVDALMFKFVQMEREGKINLKKSGKGKKKRVFSLGSQENLDRQSTVKGSKSQESITKP